MVQPDAASGGPAPTYGASVGQGTRGSSGAHAVQQAQGAREHDGAPGDDELLEAHNLSLQAW